MTRERFYHVIAVNEKSGAATFCTSKPVTHDEGCTILAKLTKHPAARLQLQEIRQDTNEYRTARQARIFEGKP